MAQPYSPSRVLEPKDTLQGAGNPASLENVIVDTLVDGSLCYVRDVDDIYVLDKFSVAPVAAPNVIATIKGAAVPGRWKRYASTGYYEANWAVTDWYIDGITGNDLNNGTSLSSPIRTGAELAKRLGPRAIWSNSVTVHIGIGGMIDPLVLHGILTDTNEHIDVIGTPTVVRTGIVTTYVAHSHASRTATRITSVDIPDWTPYQGYRIAFTSGAGAGGVSWLTKADPGGVGVATTELVRPSGIDSVSTTNLAKHVVPVVGNEFQIQTLPQIPSIVLTVEGSCARTNAAQWPARRWSIQNVDCPIVQVVGSSPKIYSRALIFGCKVGVIDDSQCGTDRAITERCGCNFAYQDPDLARGVLSVNGECLDCAFTCGGSCVVQINDVFTAHYPLFENTYLWIRGFGKARIEGGQWFDGVVADLCIYAETGCDLWLFDASGDRNAGWGLGLDVNSRARLAGVLDIRGASGTGALVWPTWIDLTYTQLRQPSDYSQKGTTAAMTAGAVTVTVPWYSSATQKPLACHATPGGTIGILSVATISDTQFIITSSSNLDTSTVHWFIPPLGRNILVTSV